MIGPTDWYFQLPLWLQTPCAGEILWAFNSAHLSFLESYVPARDRRRLPNVNRSAASRLPMWIKSAKNREAVLHAIAILSERILQCWTQAPPRLFGSVQLLATH